MHDRSVQQVESGLVWIGEEELWRSGDRTGKQELEAGGAELGVECGAERSGAEGARHCCWQSRARYPIPSRHTGEALNRTIKDWMNGIGLQHQLISLPPYLPSLP